MSDPGALWIAGFRAAQDPAEMNAALRNDGLPLLRGLPGVTDSFAGRRGVDREWDHLLVATVRDTDAAAVVDGEMTAWLRRRWPLDLSVESSIRPMAAVLRFERSEVPTILRLFSGRVRPGQLEAYVEAARRGTLADAANGHGPSALCIALEPPVGFATVSVWASWADIEAATGGNISQPIATKRHGSLIGGDASHFELLAEPHFGPPTALSGGSSPDGAPNAYLPLADRPDVDLITS